MRILIPLALVLQGCCLSPGFVASQREFYDVVAPEYRHYVETDASLSEEQRVSRIDMLEAEEAVLSEAEAAQ